MKPIMILLITFFLGIIGQASAMEYQAGTLEALQYLNNEWVNKPRQMKHERDLMRIQSEGYGSGQMRQYQPQMNAVACHPVPIYSNIDGSMIGYGKRCF